MIPGLIEVLKITISKSLLLMYIISQIATGKITQFYLHDYVISGARFWCSAVLYESRYGKTSGRGQRSKFNLFCTEV